MKKRIFYILGLFLVAAASASCAKKIPIEFEGGDAGFLDKKFSEAQQATLAGRTLLLTLEIPAGDGSAPPNSDDSVLAELSFKNREAARIRARLAPQEACRLAIGFYVLPDDEPQSLSLDKGAVLMRAQILEPRFGCALSSCMEFYFGPNGGSVPARDIASGLEGTKFDFSQFAGIFPSPAGARYEIGMNPELENRGELKIQFGEEKISINRTIGLTTGERATIQCAALKKPFCVADFGASGGIQSVLLLPNDRETLALERGASFRPLLTDPGLLIRWSSKFWRQKQYELYEWESFPGVLFFDTADYNVQGKFFTRLAFFAEKAGYRGRLVSDKELAGKHGYNAHDYKPESLAEFFSLAERQNFPLNQHEILLRDILLHNGVIIRNQDGAIVPGHGAVISISQESPEYLRRTFVNHEAWHAIYFTQPEFRKACDAEFEKADPRSLKFLLEYFALWPSLQYDPKDSYLIRNEFMAYLMQQPVSQCGAYFCHLAGFKTVQREMPSSANYVISTGGAGFEASCRNINSFTGGKWGLYAGKIYYVTR